MKMISALVLATLLGASPALAYEEYESTFGQPPIQNDSTRMHLGLVRAAEDGVVEIYNFHKDVMGELLGSKVVTAGVNEDYDVRLTTPVPSPSRSAIAVMLIDGQVVATEELDPDRSR
jgi:hypothetical protein